VKWRRPDFEKAELADVRRVNHARNCITVVKDRTALARRRSYGLASAHRLGGGMVIKLTRKADERYAARPQGRAWEGKKGRVVRIPHFFTWKASWVTMPSLGTRRGRG